MIGNIADFTKLIRTFLLTRAMRSFLSVNEAMLQSTVEMLLDKPDSRVSELCLMINGEFKKGYGRYGDIFILPTDGNEPSAYFWN